MNKTLLVIFSVLLSVTLQSLAEPNFPPNLSERAKQVYREKYEPAARDKAFAITKDGQHFYYVYGRKTPGIAARSASLGCLQTHAVPCMVWKVNDDDILSAYAKAEDESAKAIADLPADIPDYDYGFEGTKTNIAAPATLRDGTQIHSATPVDAPTGVQTISTRALVKLYKTEPGLVVVDSLSGPNASKETLPKASWLNGSGWSQGDKNSTIEANFAKAIQVIAPNKDTAIVSYCLDYECWLSWNASMRLAAMGYKRVYWYRGGTEAWKRAKLPFVDTPITAPLW